MDDRIGVVLDFLSFPNAKKKDGRRNVKHWNDDSYEATIYSMRATLYYISKLTVVYGRDINYNQIYKIEVCFALIALLVDARIDQPFLITIVILTTIT